MVKLSVNADKGNSGLLRFPSTSWPETEGSVSDDAVGCELKNLTFEVLRDTSWQPLLQHKQISSTAARLSVTCCIAVFSGQLAAVVSWLCPNLKEDDWWWNPMQFQGRFKKHSLFEISELIWATQQPAVTGRRHTTKFKITPHKFKGSNKISPVACFLLLQNSTNVLVFFVSFCSCFLADY